MPNLRVPKKHLPGLRIFIELPDDAHEKVISELRTSDWSLNPETSLSSALAKAGSLSVGDRNKASTALMSLCVAHATSSLSAADFVEDVVTILQEEAEAAPPPASIKARLVTLLNVEPLVLSAKALSVYMERPRIFTKSRVITDVRPVFADSTERPPAAIVVHTLNIHYFEGLDHKEFYVGLDTDELQGLIDVLLRAQDKAKAIEATIQKAGTRLISTTK